MCAYWCTRDGGWLLGVWAGTAAARKRNAGLVCNQSYHSLWRLNYPYKSYMSQQHTNGCIILQQLLLCSCARTSIACLDVRIAEHRTLGAVNQADGDAPLEWQGSPLALLPEEGEGHLRNTVDGTQAHGGIKSEVATWIALLSCYWGRCIGDASCVADGAVVSREDFQATPGLG